ncbi:MAG: FHIPEP family type III secretion protein, partial [Pseudomonadota bacterium]
MSGNTLMARIAESLRHGDIALAFGVLGILVVLILPMPSIMLDLLLAVSITFSVMVLLTSLFIEKPLHFSSFPTVLLIAT